MVKRDGWRMRFVNEGKLHENNCFWTLTYAPQFRPAHGSVRMADASAFVKRLRRRVEPVRFRFAAKTEYGPNGEHAPHVHGLFFGFDFEDRVLFRTTDAGEPSYFSELLSDTWGKGHCECSDLTPRSCGYVANHNVDKLVASFPDEFYSWVDPETGELCERERESSRYSLRPAIGKGWIDRFEGDCFPSGYLIEDGFKTPVPRYYAKRLKDRYSLPGSRAGGLAPVDDARVMSRKARKRGFDPKVQADNTPERLAVREECLHLKVKRLRRDAI